MKNFIPFLIFFLFLSGANAKTTKFSKYAAKQYAEKIHVEKTHINVKKEHFQEFPHNLQNDDKVYIVYGYGDIKTGRKRKKRISYMVILNAKMKPIWSSITESD